MIKSISDTDVLKKDVLLRVDLNIPFENKKILDISRITAILPTIKLILKKGGRPILLSHFGRPQKPYNESLSLKNILPKLTETLKTEVLFCNSTDTNYIKNFLETSPKTKVILLENTRFFEGEEINCSILSKALSKLGDIYCNDAFSAAHRSHASTVGVAKMLPAYSGLLLEKELSALNRALLSPQKPLAAVIGGSKISTKIPLLNNLLKKVNHMIIGGAMANTFLLAQGKEIGLSLSEPKFTQLSREILRNATKSGCRIHLPVDVVCAVDPKNSQTKSIHDTNSCPPNKMILDSGPSTINNIENILKTCKTLIWNGPVGAFEIKPFNNGTDSLAKIVAKLTKENHFSSFAGGGDTVAALKAAKVYNELTYVSNAGGAFLEWMEGKKLPGIKALNGL